MRLYFKFGDIFVYIFIALIIVGSFLGLSIIGADANHLQVTIRVGEETIGTYGLPAGDEEKEIRVDSGDGQYNIVIIASTGTYVKEANCRDDVCVRWGKINRPGQTIVCLPHRLVVSIIGEGNEPAVDDISS
ncbi:MAG TPA: NusG domain II-containing protein [Bacillota bacterium]|nr:NusG domain II-containing protein [Bacillota bacterium]